MILKLLPLIWFLMLSDGDPADDKDDAPPSDGDGDEATPEDTTALKNAYEREKAKRKQLADDLKAARQAKTELDELKATQRKREEAEATEKGEYKTLLEQRDAELAELKRQIAERDRDELRARIARKHNLPEDAAKYLTGDDEEAIEASAKDLAKLTARREDVDTDSGKPNAGGGGGKKSESLLATYKFGTRR